MSATRHERSVKRTRFDSDTTPAPARKRVKRESETSVTVPSGRKQRSKQQTLTQIDFVRSSGPKGTEGFDDNDLTELELLPTPNEDASWSSRRQSRASTTQPWRKSSTRTPSVRKRDSTLTQMDFFRGGMEEDDNDVKLDETLIGGTIDDNDLAMTIPAFDGPAEMPTKIARKRGKAPSVKKRARNPTPKTPSTEGKTLDECGHQRSKRRKLEDENAGSSTRKRKSESDKLAPMLEYDASRARTRRTTKTWSKQNEQDDLPRSPVLEIQETASIDLSPVRERTITSLPVTPIKSRDRVPSSQTPESIIPSTKKSRRKPLAEKSVNIQVSPIKPTKFSPVRLRSQPSPKRKICVLKVPPRAHLPHSTRTEDHQHDLWSMQATSSLSDKENSTGNESATDAREVMETPSEASNLVGLSGHSQNIENRSTAPGTSVNDQVSLTAATAVPVKPHGSPTNAFEVTDGKSVVGRFPTPTQQKSCVDSKNVLNQMVAYDQDPVNMIPEYSEITTDEISDLGSPVPNETQFVRDLLERISSPIPISRSGCLHQQRDVSPSRSATSAASLPIPPLRRTPIPTPRLVHTSPFRTSQEREAFENTTSTTAKPSTSHRPLLQHGSSSVRIIQVPLNDTNSYAELKNLSSSSPILPPQPKPDSMTEKSVYPASMPHPSQISTQAPSQLYFPTSSAPKLLTCHDSDVERITIIDSSSATRRSSQFRRYTDEDGETEMIEIGDSEQDDDLDIDLDPSSLQQVTPSRYRGQNRTSGTQQTKYTQPPEVADDDVTQTPTQKVRGRNSLLKRRPTTQSSPIITNATTRSQRDAMLEVIALPSSSPFEAAGDQMDTQQATDNLLENEVTPRPIRLPRSSSDPTFSSQNGKTIDEAPSRKEQGLQKGQLETRSESPVDHSISSPSSSAPSPVRSSPSPRPLKRRYDPIPGFNNETQYDLTQNGHTSAAYIHRMREDGLLPDWFVPKPHKPDKWKKGDSRNLLGSTKPKRKTKARK